MDNGMGGSNGLRQAPPPPPLPAGFHLAAPENTRQQSAQPAQHAKAHVSAQSRSMQAPPPPPLPGGFHEANPAPGPQAVAPGLTRGAGRTSMSLADAEREKEQEELRKSMPVPAPEDQKPALRVPRIGEECFARSPMDGLYYYGTVSEVGEEEACVVFFDDVQAQLPFAKIVPIDQAIDEMQCFANYSGRGTFFPAQIESRSGDAVSVHYDENPDIQETLSIAMIRFAIR